MVAATRPNDTPDAPVKPLPVIVIVVPPPVVPRKLVPVIVTQVLSPAGSPLLGLTLVTVGTDPAVYVKWSAEEVDDVPVYDVTVTSTVPVL